MNIKKYYILIAEGVTDCTLLERCCINGLNTSSLCEINNKER